MKIVLDVCFFCIRQIKPLIHSVCMYKQMIATNNEVKGTVRERKRKRQEDKENKTKNVNCMHEYSTRLDCVM